MSERRSITRGDGAQAATIAGTLNLGTGDRFDPDAESILKLGAGSYSSMPAKMTHFGWITGERILQLSSIGLWQVVYVNPADDPRLAGG